MTKTSRAIDSQDLAILGHLANLKDDSGRLFAIKPRVLAKQLNQDRNYPDWKGATPKAITRKLVKLESMNFVRQILTKKEMLSSVVRYPSAYWIITKDGMSRWVTNDSVLGNR